MPELLFVVFALGAIFAFPTISGLFARRLGRPFWKWFFIGCVLPMISVFILFFLPDKSLNNE